MVVRKVRRRCDRAVYHLPPPQSRTRSCPASLSYDVGLIPYSSITNARGSPHRIDRRAPSVRSRTRCSLDSRASSRSSGCIFKPAVSASDVGAHRAEEAWIAINARRFNRGTLGTGVYPLVMHPLFGSPAPIGRQIASLAQCAIDLHLPYGQRLRYLGSRALLAPHARHRSVTLCAVFHLTPLSARRMRGDTL